MAGKTTKVKPVSGMKLREAIRDILGVTPHDVTVRFKKAKQKLGPGGARAGDGSWDGNIYKYRF